MVSDKIFYIIFRLFTRCFGLFLICFSFIYLLSLISFDLTDPSFNTASTDEKINNWMGNFGSHLADLSFQLIGISSFFLYLIVIGAILYSAFLRQNIFYAALFLILFAGMIFRPLFTAIKEPVGKNIGKAVKAGVISLILMDAAWASAYGQIFFAMLIAILLPLSLWLAKRFAVT